MTYSDHTYRSLLIAYDGVLVGRGENIYFHPYEEEAEVLLHFWTEHATESLLRDFIGFDIYNRVCRGSKIEDMDVYRFCYFSKPYTVFQDLSANDGIIQVRGTIRWGEP